MRGAVEDVVTDRAGEQERLLQDEADLCHPLLRRVGTDIPAIEQHRARGGIVEPRHQRGGGGLSPAGWPDQRVGLAPLEGEAHRFQHLGAIGVVEGDVVEGDGGSRRRCLGGNGRHVGLQRQHFRDAVETGQRQLQRRPDTRQLA